MCRSAICQCTAERRSDSEIETVTGRDVSSRRLEVVFALRSSVYLNQLIARGPFHCMGTSAGDGWRYVPPTRAVPAGPRASRGRLRRGLTATLDLAGEDCGQRIENTGA